MVLESIQFNALIENDLQIMSLSWHRVCSYLRRERVKPVGKNNEKYIKNAV